MLIKLSSKGQLVIPRAIREALHLRAGTQFHVQVEGELSTGRLKTQRIAQGVHYHIDSRTEAAPGAPMSNLRQCGGS